jgi:hypothetical protein
LPGSMFDSHAMDKAARRGSAAHATAARPASGPAAHQATPTPPDARNHHG